MDPTGYICVCVRVNRISPYHTYVAPAQAPHILKFGEDLFFVVTSGEEGRVSVAPIDEQFPILSSCI